jgi:hypothetical protein
VCAECSHRWAFGFRRSDCHLDAPDVVSALPNFVWRLKHRFDDGQILCKAKSEGPEPLCKEAIKIIRNPQER